jgi:hypothetical protein
MVIPFVHFLLSQIVTGSLSLIVMKIWAIDRSKLAWIAAFVGACTFLSICLL